jgi:hypothetical protein
MGKRVNKLFFKTALIMLLMAGIPACDNGGRGTNVSHNPVVIEKANVLLDAIKAGDYGLAIKQYPESYFLKQSPEGWIQKLKTLQKEQGVMQSYELKKSQADTRFSGKFYILEYTAIHEGNRRVNHIITLLAPVEGGDIIIVGHKMTPWQDERLGNSYNSDGKKTL